MRVYLVLRRKCVRTARRENATPTAAANRNTSGIDCSLMTLTMTAKEYLWIGFCFPRAVFVDVRTHYSHIPRFLRLKITRQTNLSCINLLRCERTNITAWF